MEDGSNIIDMGVRIFPVGLQEDTYAKSGTEVSKNVARRTARGARRLYDRYKLRRKQLKKLLLQLDMLPPEHLLYTSKQLYGLRKRALDEKITLQELGRIFLLLNQRRGFKSNKKDSSKTADEAKKLSETLEAMKQLSKKVDESHCRTVGEYFYSLFTANVSLEDWSNPDEPVERIRKRFVYRALYEREFDLIWEAQQKFHPNELTNENRIKIKDNCIYYQRKLKSQKHLITHCRFEPSKRVCPKSSLEFQEFRIWHVLSTVRVTTDDRFHEFLTLSEKERAAAALQEVSSMTHPAFVKAVGLPRNPLFNEIPEKILGNTTRARMVKQLGAAFVNAQSAEQLNRLWHTLYFAIDEEWLAQHANSKLGMSIDEATKYASIEVEQEYSNISTKAIRKILPFMKLGKDYATACATAGYHHSSDEETDSKDRILSDKIERETGDEIDQLRNPLVQQSIGETIRVVNAIIRDQGKKPDRIRIELARSFKQPKSVREKTKKRTDETRARRDLYRDFLEKQGYANMGKSELLKFELWLEMELNEIELAKINDGIDIEDYRSFAREVKAKDLEKYHLWLECGRISPYTGKVIGLSELFSGEIEVEHIIPYSRCMNDSYINKTLCEHAFNTSKGNQTPYEYFKDKPAELRNFKNRIKNFSEGKKEQFMLEAVQDDFLNSQLNNTAYVAKEVRKKMKTICRDVRITNGQATSNLRRFWGLNTILNPDGKNIKSRDDHRHHAIDALVIANTTENNIRLLAMESKFENGRMKRIHVAPPYDTFRFEAEEKLNQVLVSFRNKRRLLVSQTNKYVHGRRKNQVGDYENIPTQQTYSARGPLHKEFIYGSIDNPHSGEQSYVIRKELRKLTESEIEKIVDPRFKKVVQDFIAGGGNLKDLDPSNKDVQPLFMMNKYGEKSTVPIWKVRIENTLEKELKRIPRGFVSSGDNYMLAIYKDVEAKKKKFDFLPVSFFDAIQQRRTHNPLIPLSKNGKPLWFTIKKLDLVVRFDNSEDEIDWHSHAYLRPRLYLVTSIDINGRLVLEQHFLSNVKKGDHEPLRINPSVSTLNAIPVRLSTTGKIIRAEG